MDVFQAVTLIVSFFDGYHPGIVHCVSNGGTFVYGTLVWLVKSLFIVHYCSRGISMDLNQCYSIDWLFNFVTKRHLQGFIDGAFNGDTFIWQINGLSCQIALDRCPNMVCFCEPKSIIIVLSFDCFICYQKICQFLVVVHRAYDVLCGL